MAGGRRMVEEEGLLQEIVTHPEDDAPRLVYADWLEDHGQPQRAEFIRLQIEVARIEEAEPRGPTTSILVVEGRGFHPHLSLQGSAPDWHHWEDPHAKQLRQWAWDLLREHGEGWCAAF